MRISLKNVSFAYDKTDVLRGVNLEFDSGEFLAIIGPNGGGKSTLLKLILALETARSGSVEIDGRSAASQRGRLGFVPQSIPFAQSFPITALEVVQMGLLRGVGGYGAAARAAARAALARVGLAGFEARQLGELSGGQRQRVFVARALATGAEVLLLDEPTASIDPAGQVEIFELLRELNAAGTGVIVVCHDVGLAMGFAGRVAFVSGELVLHEAARGGHGAEFIRHLRGSHEHFCAVEVFAGRCNGECLFHR